MRGRTKGTGSLDERPKGSGKWRLRMNYGTDPGTGKRRVKSWTFEAKNRREAERLAGRILDEFESTVVTIPSKTPVARLLEEHLQLLTSRGRSPRYLDDFAKVSRNIIGPALGTIPVDELSVRAIDQFISDLIDTGRAPATVRRYCAVLRSALAQAVRWGWIERSPMDRVSMPEVPIKQVHAPTPAQVQALISAAQAYSPQFGMFVLLAAVTGMRRGELAALRWNDIDGSLLHVHSSVYRAGRDHGVKSTKSGRERIVVLDPLILERLVAYRSYLEQQARDFPTGPVKIAKNGYIFPGRPDQATPANIDTYSSNMAKIALDLQMPEIHLHSLRHFHATELIAAGQDPVNTAQRLGHANPTMTLRVYAHAVTERQIEAANIGARILGNPTI